MKIDPNIKRAMGEAFDEDDIQAFSQLLMQHPEYIRDFEDGTDWWMWMAAMDGKLPFLKLVVDLGLDVNESKDIADPDNPFCTFEGPILQAASNGHIDIVRWLLEKGAKINCTVNGKVRCLPLLDAACNGHLEVVKLLVENGAELNFEFNGHTPVSQAEDYGQSEVAAYLRSVGAK